MRRRPLLIAVLATACLLFAAASASASITIAQTSPANPVNEGQTGSTPVIYTITRQAPLLAGSASVQVQTADETATAGADYTAVDQTVNFPGSILGGTQTAVVEVDVLGDTISENDETYRVGLSSASGDTIGTPSFARTTIADAGPLPSLSVSNASVQEGTGGTGPTMHIPVILTPHSERTVTVHYSVAPGTATPTADYTPVSGTLTFAPGETSKTIDVPVVPDALDEPDETVIATIDTPVNATIADATAAGTILDDDPTPSLTAGDASVVEGTGGTGPTMHMPVALSAASARTVTVHYTVGEGTATAGDDFTPSSGTLTFAPGDIAKTIDVPVVPDALDETDETVILTLDTPVNATITHGTGTGTIVDDDPTPSLSIADGSVVEGTGGTGPTMHMSVTLSAASGRQVTVHYAVAGGTATAIADFTAVSGTLTFAAGQTSKTIDVPVVPDALNEADETVIATLDTPVAATISRATATGTILDDDPLPALSVADASVQEGTGGPGTTLHVPVTLNTASGRTVTVHYAVAAGTATANADFTPASGTLTIAAGQTGGTIDVAVVPDNIDESNETVAVTIDTPVHATIGTASATGTILDDDTATISISGVSQNEGNSGLTAFDFPVRLSTPSDHTVTVDWATKDIASGGAVQPALAGTDYDTANGTATFPAGTVSQTATVQVHGNTTIEPTKRFEVDLTNPTGAAIDGAHNSAFGDILDDDTPPSGGGTTPPPVTTPPKTTPPNTTPPKTTPPKTTPKDKTLPTVKITRPKGHKILTISGTAKDTGSGVASVRVGFVFLDAKGCHYLATTKKFKKSACTKQFFVKATGKKSWHLRLPSSARGPIVIYARAIDKAGNVGKIKQLRLVIS
jgi:hypothetical protein